jgi:SP family general alpha glucoside:H+ symporter-like MFS transporter
VAVQVNLRDDIADYDRVVEDARKATESEHHLSIMQGLRKYPKACAWSMLLSTAIM